VARVDFRSCSLIDDDGHSFEAVATSQLMGRSKALGNTVVVGDRVTFETEIDRTVVSTVLPRRNAFSRRASGERPEEQVVAANLDQVVLVCSIRRPAFRAGLADRVLCQAEHAGLPARLVLNKCDLDDAHEIERVIDAYAGAGYSGYRVSALEGDGLDALRAECAGRRSLFVGHSGVGKSTLLNALVPGLELLSGGVNVKTGKGRHTTTAAWLIRVAPDLELIDTPGVRTFGLWGVSARDLERSYPDFLPFLGSCKFADCRHAAEPACAVRAAAEQGRLSPRRLESFLQLRAELEHESARA
jgi:ribosome biogenesis GTPase